jgi:hypothetical protein
MVGNKEEGKYEEGYLIRPDSIGIKRVCYQNTSLLL